MNKLLLLTILSVLTFIFSITSMTAQTNLWTESFETDGEGVRYTNSNTFRDATGDYYTRTDGVTPSINVTGGPYVTSDGSFYFAGEDLDDTGTNGGDGLTTKIFTKTGIDITGYTSLNFKGLFGGGTGGWDTADGGILVEAQIDGGGYTRTLSFKHNNASGTGFNNPLAQDVDGDGLGEGTTLTAILADFTGGIAGSGAALDIRITSECTSGSEEFAFDFLRVEGTIPSGIAEINLQSSTSTNITNGDSDPSIGEGTDFGTVELGMTATSTITIQNTGGADLTAGAITISGVDMADFAITNYTAGVIASAGSITFDIEFTPSSAAVKNAMVSIVNDDSDENPYEFDITGEGFSLEEIAITEFMVAPNSSGVEFVEIYNFGATPIDLMDWRLRDEDTDTDVISATSLIINVGEYLILVSNKVGYEAIWFNGIICDQVVEIGGFAFANGTDEIMLENGNGDIVWSLAYANDDAPGIATHYTEATFTNRFWGSKAVPGINRDGNDVTGSLGYEKNNATTDLLVFASANADMGSPLNQTACYGNEIDVQGGAILTSIMSGDATPEAADGTEVIAIIGNASTQTFTIENEGSAEDLTITAITSDNVSFTISAPTFPLIISAGMTATFTVGFTSTMIATSTATITVANDDADEATYTFGIEAISPDLMAGDGCTAAVTAAVDASGTMVHFLDASGGLVASVRSIGTDFSASGNEISFFTNLGSATSSTAVDGNPYLIMGRQFNIESAVVAPYGGVTVRLYFNNSDYSDLSGVSCPTCPAMTTASDVEVSHYDGTNQNCDQSDNDYSTTPSENLGGAYGTYGSTAFYIEVNPTHFSEFFGHQANAILFPVELIDFSLTPIEEEMILKWTTATETNSDKFVIERSYDGILFEAIGEERAQGNSTTEVMYEFVDNDFANVTVIYYRLRQIDFDGTEAFSEIKSINLEKDRDIFSISPNPTRGNLNIDLGDNEVAARIQIVDIAGKIVYSTNITASGLQKIDTEFLVEGIYFLNINSDNERMTLKFIKE
jgi:hypothetical protein